MSSPHCPSVWWLSPETSAALRWNCRGLRCDFRGGARLALAAASSCSDHARRRIEGWLPLLKRWITCKRQDVFQRPHRDDLVDRPRAMAAEVGWESISEVRGEKRGRSISNPSTINPNQRHPHPPFAGCKAGRRARSGLQGYLAHKKQPPPLGSPQGPRHSPTVEF